jgi:Domain of unknown function (DU1801)
MPATGTADMPAAVIKTNRMQSTASTPQQYLAELPDDRKQVINDLRNVILKNLPQGFTEVMNCGMIGYVVPHSLFPQGYHCDPKQPLPFMNLASQKNYVALYHLGLYADQDLLSWFTGEYSRHSKTKLDMGKSCIRFKKPDQVPLELIGQLASKITPQEWIAAYETQIRKQGNRN